MSKYVSQEQQKEKLLCEFALEYQHVPLCLSVFCERNMVVHADQGLRETTILNVEREMGWGIVNTEAFCYSCHSFHCDSGSFQVY